MSCSAPNSVASRTRPQCTTVDDLIADPTRVQDLDAEVASKLLGEIVSRAIALRIAQSALMPLVTSEQSSASPATVSRPIETGAGTLSFLQPSSAATCKPYLSIAELARLTPWTNQAIRTMISKGVLRDGEHFFYVGRRPVFKWTAIVSFIEGVREPLPIPHYRDTLNNAEKT